MTAPKALEQSITVSLDIGLDTVLGHGFGGYDPDGEPVFDAPITLANMVADRLAQQLLSEAKKQIAYTSIAQRIDAAVNDAVKEKIGDVLEREIVPTDRYGNAKGEPTTLAEIIAKRTDEWMREPETRSGYSSNRTKLQAVIDDAVGRTFASDLQKVVKLAQAAATAEVSARAAEVFAEIIKRAAS